MKQPRIWPTAVAAGAITLGLLAQPVNAQDPSDSAVGTVQISDEIRSVTVSPNAFQFSECRRGSTGESTIGLTFPNGVCEFPDGVTITNGETQAHIHVRADNFVGSDGVGEWTFNPFTTSPTPGEDEVVLRLAVGGPNPLAQSVSTGGHCDGLWDTAPPDPDDACLAGPGQSVTEVPSVEGPTASTNTSPSFSTTITWTAMP